MLVTGLKDWMKALEAPCLHSGLSIDWELTEWSGDETVYFEHPGSPARRGRIARDADAYMVTYEVRIVHSRLDPVGAKALVERRLGSLLDAGATIDPPMLVPGHRDIWGAEVRKKVGDTDAAAEWGKRLVLEALDIVDTGRDGYVLDRLGMAFFREHLHLAQALDELVFGLHRRDWWGQKELPKFPCYDGPGMALFHDRHGRIIHTLLESRESLWRALQRQYSSTNRDFVDCSGVVESFWILPLRSSIAWRWGSYIQSWFEAHAEQYLMDPYDLDPEEECWW